MIAPNFSSQGSVIEPFGKHPIEVYPMIKQLLTATAFLFVATAQAEPHGNCLTNELEDRLITADLAVAAGNCHLARASDEGQAVSALEYAHSWFLQAQTLGSSQARRGLDLVEKKLAQAGQAHE
jgi:hypothetical protein